MVKGEKVVRLIQPADKPQPASRALEPQPGETMNAKIAHYILNGITLAAIASVCLFIGVNYFHLGFSVNDLMVMMGLPLAVGALTSYAIF